MGCVWVGVGCHDGGAGWEGGCQRRFGGVGVAI